jgi:hypothetical protein
MFVGMKWEFLDICLFLIGSTLLGCYLGKSIGKDRLDEIKDNSKDNSKDNVEGFNSYSETNNKVKKIINDYKTEYFNPEIVEYKTPALVMNFHNHFNPNMNKHLGWRNWWITNKMGSAPIPDNVGNAGDGFGRKYLDNLENVKNIYIKK